LNHPPVWAAAALAIREQEPTIAAFTVALKLQTDHGFKVTGRQVQELFMHRHQRQVQEQFRQRETAA